MKKMISLLLAGTLAVALTGCGTGGNSEQPSASVKEQSSASESNQTSGPMELTMYFPVSVGGGPDALIDALCKEYHEENPDVIVKPIYAGSYADTRTKVQAAIKAGNAPDMAIMFSIDLYSLRAMDAIQDMNSLCVTDEDKEWLDGFYEGFMMNSKDGDTTYGIPWQRSTIILYYNKEAMAAAGLDPETHLPPGTR